MPDSRETVIRTITFANPLRLPVDFPQPFGTDFAWTGMSPSPDDRPARGADEWGAVWENIGVCNLGQVVRFPLASWSDFAGLRIPDIDDPARWTSLAGARDQAGDKFLLAYGVSIYERVHFIRGLENTWMDILEHPNELCRLIDILVEMNLAAIEKYAAAGVDGLFILDDWGLQNRLMIPPESWSEIWKPRYRRIFEAAHLAGLYTFLHSCGHIVDILEGLIETGLDVIQLDQQENMGLELLRDRFRERITFFCPVDIQATMACGDPAEIRAYCRKMADCLGTAHGGFMPKWYSDPKGAGHSQEAIRAMCEEFLTISREKFGAAGPSE